MLKRKLGVCLLTLLVITGLAGTINENSITNPERKSAAGLMKDTYKDVVEAVNGLSDQQLNFRAADDKWSVKECMYHIAATEKSIWSQLEGAMKSQANPEKRSEIKLTDEQVVKIVEDRSFKARAPETVQPKNTGFKSLDEALTDFKSHRMNHIKYMKTTTEDLRNHVVQLPFGWVDCYQLYLFIAGHSNRHTQQMNEVKADPGFPK